MRLSEGPLPTAPRLCSGTVALSRFPPSSGAPHSRSLAQRVPLFRGEAAGSGTSHPASIKMPARLAAPAPASLRGLLLEVYGRSRGLLCAGGRKAGREPWLFAVCARRCTVCSHPSGSGATCPCLSRLSPASVELGDRSETRVKASCLYLC